jgi:hypothetical protein
VIEVVRIGVEEIAVRLAQPLANINDVEPGTRREFEGDLDG